MSALLPKPPRHGPKPPRPIARRARPRQQRDTELARLEREADALCRRLVRERDRGRCLACHRPGSDTAHGIRRDFRATRWRLSNLFYLCRSAHRRLASNPELWRAFRVGLRGEAIVARDEADAQRGWKPAPDELRDLITRLQRGEAA